MKINGIETDELNLKFSDRAEFRILMDICHNYDMSDDEIYKVINSYLKAYVTGIIDNYEYLFMFVNVHSWDKFEIDNFYVYGKDHLIEDLYELKCEVMNKYIDLYDLD